MLLFYSMSNKNELTSTHTHTHTIGAQVSKSKVEKFVLSVCVVVYRQVTTTLVTFIFVSPSHSHLSLSQHLVVVAITTCSYSRPILESQVQVCESITHSILCVSCVPSRILYTESCCLLHPTPCESHNRSQDSLD